VGIAYAAAVASLPFTATNTSAEWSSACLLPAALREAQGAGI